MTTCLKRAVHSVYCACLSWAFVKFCVCPSFPFCTEGRMWDVIVLIPDDCLSIYFSICDLETKYEGRSDALQLIVPYYGQVLCMY